MYITNEKRQAFVDQCRRNQTTSTPVSSIQTFPSTSHHFLTYQPSSPPTPLPVPDRPQSTLGASGIDPNLQSPSRGFDEQYDDYEEEDCATAEVPLATVQIRLEGSNGSRLLVPVSFKGPGGLMIPATVLVDTGAMANFVNESFVRQHDLKIRPRNTPIRCVGFDGREGVGGLVTQDWAGMIQLSTIDSKPFTLQSSFGITRLGSVDAIFGLPW
jgi:hypothetical protein